MDKFVPFEKMSKKEQREQNSKKRGSWGNVKPATKLEPSAKAYSRKEKYPKKDYEV